MTEPEKTPTQEEQTSEKAAPETPAPEETRAKEKQEFVPILYRLVAITGLISFYGPILFLFFTISLFFGLGTTTPFAVASLLALILRLLFSAIPVSAIIGLLSCILLWRASTTEADLKAGIVFSALADVFGLGFSALAPFILLAMTPFR